MKLVNVKKVSARICLAFSVIALLGAPMASTAEARTLKAPRVQVGDQGGWFDQIVTTLMALLPGREPEARVQQEKTKDVTFSPRNLTIISYTTNNGSCIDPLGRPMPCSD